MPSGESAIDLSRLHRVEVAQGVPDFARSRTSLRARDMRAFTAISRWIRSRGRLRSSGFFSAHDPRAGK